MSKKYFRVAKKLNRILKKGDIRLVDKFEKEFIKLEHKLETTAMIVYGNRHIIRRSYYIVVGTKGTDASLYDFQNLLYDYHGSGREMCVKLSKNNDLNLYRRYNNIANWMLLRYFGDGRRVDEFTYAQPTRYIVDKLIDTCENRNYSLITKKRRIFNNLNISNVKEKISQFIFKVKDILINILSKSKFFKNRGCLSSAVFESGGIQIYSSDEEDSLISDALSETCSDNYEKTSTEEREDLALFFNDDLFL